MEKNFSNWYKNKFHQLNDVPPDDTWENISNGLDLDEVWEGVNAELNKKDKRRAIAKIAALSLVLIALSGTLLLLTDKQVEINNKQPISQNAVSSSSKGKKVNVDSLQRDKEYNNNATINTTEKSTTKNNLSTSAIKIANVSTPQKENYLTVTAKQSNKNMKFLTAKQHDLVPTNKSNIDNTTNTLAEKSMIMTTITPLSVDIKTNKDGLNDSLIRQLLKDSIHTKMANENTYASSNSHFFILGAAFASANTWLINNDTYDCLRAGTLNRTLFSFGKSYNILLGYNLSNKYFLQTEWVINSIHRQKYIDYTNGHLVNRNLTIDFTQINILIKKKNEAYYFQNKLHTSFNYIAGLNYSYVKSFTQQTNETVNSLKNDYKNNQYNLILGLEYQCFISQSWIVSTGVRTNIGLQNIYKGNGYVPANFNKTYNSSIGLNIGIAYRINRKQ